MRTIEWRSDKVRIIDQTKLPHKLTFLYLRNASQIVKAIQTMKVRGAPAIGLRGRDARAVPTLAEQFHLLESRPGAQSG